MSNQFDIEEIESLEAPSYWMYNGTFWVLIGVIGLIAWFT